MDYKYLIIEHYLDGGTWKHFFHNKIDADWNLEALKDAHKGRTYELIKLG